MKTIDARGLSCPEPVIMTKNALASGEKEYEVLVDNVTAKENVTRFAAHQGYLCEISGTRRTGFSGEKRGNSADRPHRRRPFCTDL